MTRWLLARAMRTQHEAEDAAQAGDYPRAERAKIEAGALFRAAVEWSRDRIGPVPDASVERQDPGSRDVQVELTQDYARRLRERMAAIGLSAADLARKTGINASQFSRWFGTDQVPSVRNIQKIEAAMKPLERKGTKRPS